MREGGKKKRITLISVIFIELRQIQKTVKNTREMHKSESTSDNIKC